MSKVFKINPTFYKKLDKAIKLGLEEAAIVFEKTAQKTTIREDHVVTSRYLHSINHNNEDRLKGTRNTIGEGEGVHIYKKESNTVRSLTVGSKALDPVTNVIYTASLESKYRILLRSKDDASVKMVSSLAKTLIKNII